MYLTNSGLFRKANCIRILILVGLGTLGCSSEQPAQGSSRSASRATNALTTLTTDASLVMGFENVSDWTGISGTNSLHTQGAVSGEVSVSGWTQIASIPLSTIAEAGNEIGDAAALDIYLPEAASWGEVRLIVDIPSKGVSWWDLGGNRLEIIEAGSFQEISYSLPAEISAALNGNYSDLRVIVIVNAPSLSAPVLLDNLRFEGTETAIDTETVAVPFMFDLPDSVPLKSVAIQASESVKISDVDQTVNALANVVNMGDGSVEIGVESEIDGNIYAGGDVILRDRSRIQGFVRAAGSINEGNDVEIDDGGISGTSLTAGGTYQWNANWPTVNGVYTVNDTESLELSEGGYASLTLNSGGVLNLSAGTYYFDNFLAHSGATINIAGNGDPVILYVRDSFTCRSTLHHTQSSADFFVGFAGEGVVDLDGPYAGTVVAPNATIRLAPLNGGAHEGSFFAKNILAEAQTPIHKVPFEHWQILLPDPEYPIPVEPPSTLPIPPTENGCYKGTWNGWVEVPCTTAQEMGLPNLNIEWVGINSVPLPEGGTIPFEFGQLQTTFVKYGGLVDSATGKNEMSVQLNTNKYTMDNGHVGAHQFAIQNFDKVEPGVGIFRINGLCIWTIDVTDQDYSNVCVNGDYIPMRSSTEYQENDFANIGATTFTNASGDPKVGMVVQLTWYDSELLPWDDTGIFAVVDDDTNGLGANSRWTSVSGTLLGTGNYAVAEFTDSTILTRTLAGSCANAQGPSPDVPWPGVCEDQLPLIQHTEIGQNPGTMESNNLTIYDGPTALTSMTNDLVYTQYLASTSGQCESDADRVYVKDVPSDVGVVPSSYGGEPFWESPDIFVVPMGTQVDVDAIASEALLTPGETYEFYVRVNNDFGCAAVDGVKAKIRVANPSVLSADWEYGAVTGGQYLGGVDNNGISVAPGNRALIGPFSWTAPNDAAEAGHKCILATIVSESHGAPEDEDDAPGSFQVAQRNVQFTDCALSLTNSTTLNGYLFLTFRINEGGAMPSLETNGNRVEMAFADPGGNMYDVWQGGDGNGVEYDVSYSSLDQTTTVRIGQRAVRLAPVLFTGGRSIDATGSIVLLQGQPSTSLAMEAELYEGSNDDGDPFIQNGATCVNTGSIIII